MVFNDASEARTSFQVAVVTVKKAVSKKINCVLEQIKGNLGSTKALEVFAGNEDFQRLNDTRLTSIFQSSSYVIARMIGV
jgi:hypothetical protein